MSEIESLDDIRRLILSGESNWKQYGEVNHQIEGDLILFDYSQKAQFENRWNWFEANSRGLIFNQKTGELVAYPFEKFFNWGESGRTGTGSPVTATEKWTVLSAFCTG